MKNERLFDAIGQIDEEFIEETDPEKKQECKKKMRVKGWMKIETILNTWQRNQMQTAVAMKWELLYG